VVTTIDDAGHLSVQVVNDDVKTLENLVSRLSLYHKQDNASAAKPYQPKVGELCSAQFSEDKRWYRARIRRITNGGKSVEVVYIDYGNSETLPKESVRALPKEFTSLPPQSREINFAFLKVPARAVCISSSRDEHILIISINTLV
jgi:staphylococcal nuclease domain-containing protein 1